VLILASASPRRHELLSAAGIDHIVRPVSVSETPREGESSVTVVQRLAREKAEAARRTEEEMVLGADTLVCVDGQHFGKPTDVDDAQRMLRSLSGREHWVVTGICLLRGAEVIVDVSSTAVSFASLTEEEITDYIRSGEPFDKAGAYAIQGLASKFIVSLQGSYQNVVGLPVALVYQHLRSMTP
jgi:septum formation protein